MAEIAMRAMLAKDVPQFTVVLAPVDQFSLKQVGRLPRDREVSVDAKARRNMKQHRLYWVLMDLCAQADDRFHDEEEASDFIKYKTKHVKLAHNPVTGASFLIPKSMSEASMSAAQFRRYFDRALYVVLTEILPGVPEGELRAQIEKIVSPNYDASERSRR